MARLMKTGKCGLFTRSSSLVEFADLLIDGLIHIGVIKSSQEFESSQTSTMELFCENN